ncbi:flavin monoamine oxidase family protein [Leucobacter luti]|uniref:Monoamine oxidase n=1 Tax=Leucobacter luti TaxID=340320 RepID=A0A4Q7U7H9_9MICO|nr:FAD-dependent oxidoreductase [Leucobacter luti]MBL3700761.1 FAD-binding protein [Leucobacter luti]RZT68402.1 monoamine oxidase [Leucobacter luti]
MQQQPTDHTDVLIIGAGLAGLAAADRMRDSGRAVTVLDGADRVGGRSYGMQWPAAGRAIDMGGTWLLPSFERSFALLTELGIATTESPKVAAPVTHLAEGVVARDRAAGAEAAQLRAAIAALRDAIERSPRALTAAEALAAVPASPFARDWHAATQRYLAGAPLDAIDATHLLIDEDDLNNPDHYATQIAGTTRALVTALAERSGARILLGHAATEVWAAPADHPDSEARLRVRTASGSIWEAADVILAVPRNTLGGIRIDLPLPAAFTELAAAPHPGASRKDWFVLDGVAEHFRVFASEGSFGYFRSEARLPDGGMLAVALAPSAKGLPTPAELHDAVQAYLPGATVREHVRHDWIAEPWARGTWFVPRPGDPARNAALPAALAAATPALQIVGGDVSVDFPGTLEGAIRTGTDAADRILRAPRV